MLKETTKAPTTLSPTTTSTSHSPTHSPITPAPTASTSTTPHPTFAMDREDNSEEPIPNSDGSEDIPKDSVHNSDAPEDIPEEPATDREDNSEEPIPNSDGSEDIPKEPVHNSDAPEDIPEEPEPVTSECVENGAVNECWQCCKTSNCEGTFSRLDGIWRMTCTTKSNGEMVPATNNIPGLSPTGNGPWAKPSGRRPSPGSKFVTAPASLIDNKSGVCILLVTCISILIFGLFHLISLCLIQPDDICCCDPKHPKIIYLALTVPKTPRTAKVAITMTALMEQETPLRSPYPTPTPPKRQPMNLFPILPNVLQTGE